MARLAPVPAPSWVARWAPLLAVRSVTAPVRISAVACVAAATITGTAITAGIVITVEAIGRRGDLGSPCLPLQTRRAVDPVPASARGNQ
jgi:hypothetical protein